MEKLVGRGRILFSPLPLELGDDLAVVGNAYRYALKTAGVEAVYRTAVDPGILIAPTLLPKATLYAISSESNEAQVTFSDVRSGKTLKGRVEPGGAATVMIGTDGVVMASWNWAAE
jgi:hypothetical protein